MKMYFKEGEEHHILLFAGFLAVAYLFVYIMATIGSAIGSWNEKRKAERLIIERRKHVQDLFARLKAEKDAREYNRKHRQTYFPTGYEEIMRSLYVELEFKNAQYKCDSNKKEVENE